MCGNDFQNRVIIDPPVVDLDVNGLLTQLTEFLNAL